MGGAPVRGDFDGDGFADLAIGVPFEDVSGEKNAGAVHVLYGGAGGPTAAGSQVWHQDVAGIQDKCEEKDRFGAALVVGDFDGDGLDDLAIGVPGERTTTDLRTGAVHILWGDPGGLSAAEESFIPISVAISQEPTSDPINGGAALAAGDFNDDGFDDLAVGVPTSSVGTVGDAGEIFVFRGTDTRALTGRLQIMNQNTSGVQNSPDEGDQFGSALSADDFDGDGFCDLAVGVPGESVGGAPRAGAVNVLYGSANGLRGAGDQFFTQKSLDVAGGAERKDRFGSTLASGDFNNDGFADLAIGAPQEDGDVDVGGPQQENSGTVVVVYGSAGRLDASTAEEWNQDTGGVSNGADSGDQFGAALAAGDFDNDGNDDLAIGAPFEGIGGVIAGVVHIIYGSAGGLTASGDQLWHQDQNGIEGGANGGDKFGAALASLDFDGDGFLDLAIGIPGEKINNREGAGAVAVLFGSGSGLASAGNQLWSQDSTGIGDGPSEDDGLGAALGD
jgi:hypothetical protein